MNGVGSYCSLIVPQRSPVVCLTNKQTKNKKSDEKIMDSEELRAVNMHIPAWQCCRCLISLCVKLLFVFVAHYKLVFIHAYI